MKKKSSILNLKLKSIVLCLLLTGILITSGCNKSGRYLSTIKKPTIDFVAQLEIFSDFQREDVRQIDNLLVSSQEKVKKSDFAKAIHEKIFILIDKKIAYTVIINGQDVLLEKGKKQGVEPTLLVPMTLQIAQNLDAALADYKLDKQELFNFAYILFMPCLKHMYSMPYMFEKNVSMVKLDNFTQFKIKNPDNFLYHGQPIEISGTVINVDGMYLTFPGLIGDPDIRIELSIDEAMELYKFTAYDILENKSTLETKQLLDKYVELIKSKTVYERAWH